MAADRAAGLIFRSDSNAEDQEGCGIGAQPHANPSDYLTALNTVMVHLLARLTCPAGSSAVSEAY